MSHIYHTIQVALNNTKLENSLHKTEMKLIQQVSMETKQRLSAVQLIREQIALLQPHPQIIRRTSSTTPVPATPTNKVRPHRKLHNRHRLNSVSSHDATALIQHETQGIFTSAPATPESQQNLIVQNFSHDQSGSMTDQHDQYPLPDQFSLINPSSATTNQGFSTNQHSPDQLSLNQHIFDQHTSDQDQCTTDQHSPDHSLNQHTSDHTSGQHSLNQCTFDQHSPDQESLNQHISDQHSPGPIQTYTVQLSPTNSSN